MRIQKLCYQLPIGLWYGILSISAIELAYLVSAAAAVPIADDSPQKNLTQIIGITLICPPTAAKAMKAAFGTNPYLTGLPLPRPEILSPADLTQNTGTAEILRLPEVRELVKKDFIVLPCDLVCELGAEKLLQAWMVKAASIGDVVGSEAFPSCSQQPRHSGGIGVWYETKTNVTVKREETDFVATAPLKPSAAAPPNDSILQHISQLVYMTPTVTLKDVIEEKKSVPVRHGLLRANPRVRMYTTHRDAHIYIFPRWIIDFIQENDRMESISEDVVGSWAKATWQTGLAEKLKMTVLCASPTNDTDDDNSVSDSAISQEATIAKKTDGTNKPRGEDELPSINEPNQQSKAVFEVPPMLAYVHSAKTQEPGEIIRRVDTAQLLLAISLQLAKLPSIEESGFEGASPYAHARKVAYPEGVKSRTTITKQDSLIGENVTVEEKTSIKECVIGTGCQIQEGAKLSQCLLMDGVVVGKGCKLTKCILGKRSVIGDGSILTDCEVQENLLVEPRSK